MSFNNGDVVVHKSLGSQPLVVSRTIEDGRIAVSYGSQTQDGIKFREELFFAYELETPMDSIEREGEIFKTLTAKRKQIQDEQDETDMMESSNVIPINKLN